MSLKLNELSKEVCLKINKHWEVSEQVPNYDYVSFQIFSAVMMIIKGSEETCCFNFHNNEHSTFLQNVHKDL